MSPGQKNKESGESGFEKSLHMTVEMPFMINDVGFNSGLNKDFDRAIHLSDTEFDLVQPLVADYELNHRQLVVYVLDCEKIDCNQRQDLLVHLSELVKNTPIAIYYSQDSSKTNRDLAKKIRSTIQDLLSINMPITDEEMQFLEKPLTDLDKYIEVVVLKELNQFKRLLSQF
jgi:hypothetical protein